jgi:2-keto-myo-inositol isomerase
MKLALNGATTMKADLATDIRATRAAGFDGLEIWASKLKAFLDSNTTDALNRLFREQGIEPYSINSIERITFRKPDEHQSLIAECDSLCRIAAEIGCPCIVVVPSPLPPGTTESDVVEESVSVLSRLARVAERYKIRLGFEFLGQPDCSVQTLSLAHRIVEQVCLASVGLVLDSFHFFAGGSTIESILALDPDRLFIFHINDAEDLPRDQLQDRHRLIPGSGILPLKEIAGALKQIGYQGIASVEIFRPEYWELDPFSLAKEARVATEQLLGT